MILKRYVYLVILSVKHNCDIRDACDLYVAENGGNASKIFSADKTNCNNIYNPNNIFLKKFFKELKIVDHALILSLQEEEIFKKIHIVSRINKAIFDSKYSIFKTIKENIKNYYDPISTKNFKRNILSKKNNIASFVFEYNGEIRVLNYDRFHYDIFFNENIILPENVIIDNIKQFIENYESYDILYDFDNFIIVNITNNILEIINELR
jgi:hypothetical protein